MRIFDKGQNYRSPSDGGKERSEAPHFVIALLIIIPAFMIIGGILMLQSFTVSQVTTGMNSTEKAAIFDKLDKSNQTIFSIMLSVFGAWVGGVVAFYFGQKNVQQANDSLKNAQEALKEVAMKSGSNLSSITVKELLKKYPKAMDLVQFRISAPVGEIVKAAEDKDVTNVIIIDRNNEPIALLYVDDLTVIADKQTLKNDQTALNTLITNHSGVIKDRITKKFWTPSGLENKEKNYAELTEDDNLLTVSARLSAIGDKTGVRGIVIGTDRKAIAIVSYDMITATEKST